MRQRRHTAVLCWTFPMQYIGYHFSPWTIVGWSHHLYRHSHCRLLSGYRVNENMKQNFYFSMPVSSFKGLTRRFHRLSSNWITSWNTAPHAEGHALAAASKTYAILIRYVWKKRRILAVSILKICFAMLILSEAISYYFVCRDSSNYISLYHV